MGKGFLLDAAMASGIMEAIEDHHAEHVAGPLFRCSYAEATAAHEVVNPFRLPALAENIFTPHLPLLWSVGSDLFSGRQKLVPYELVHTDYRVPLPEGSGCFAGSSNGLASGNHFLEALVHGLCEVIERDCVARWDQASEAEQNDRRLDLSSITDEPCRALLSRFEQCGLSVGIWDISSEIKLPAFMCWLIEHDLAAASACPALGQGCHLVREIALSRALTEAAQARLTVISGARDDLTNEQFDEEIRSMGHQRWHQVLRKSGRLSFASSPSWPAEHLEDELDTVLNHLAQAGFDEAVAVDLTLPAYEIPVARIVVPGLQMQSK